MNETEVPINQTKFSFEEPIFADSAVYTEKKPEQDAAPKPKNNKRVLVVVIGIVLVVLLLLALLMASRMRRGVTQVEEDVSEPVEVQELGPLQKRIEEARELLELADPAKQDLAFPPVDLNIRLDPKEE